MAEEVRYHSYQRYLCLVVACFVITVAGSTCSFSILVTSIKNVFQLEQEAGIHFTLEKCRNTPIKHADICIAIYTIVVKFKL